MDKREQTLNNLKVLAARLAPTIYFRYLVLDWSNSCDAPVVKLFENKPSYAWVITEMPKVFLSHWEGNGKEEKYPLCIINAENLVGTSLGGISKNTDFSQFIVSNPDRE
jgi:hypothetical protein